MQCPRCNSSDVRKNGKRRDKQNHICLSCRRQFIDIYSQPKGYPAEIKQECIDLYLSGFGFRTVSRMTGISHSTIFSWVKQSIASPDPMLL